MALHVAHVSMPKFHGKSEFNLCFHIYFMNFAFSLRFYLANMKQRPISKAYSGCCIKVRSKQRLNLDSACNLGTYTYITCEVYNLLPSGT